MKKFVTALLLFITILVCFVLQTSVLPAFSFLGITPNLMVIVTASYGFMFGDRKGMFIGLVCGLFCDVCFGPLIGFQAGVYALVGFLSGKFQKILYVEDLLFPLSMIAVCDLLVGFLTYVFLFLMQNRLFFRSFFMKRMLPEMVYTVLAGLFLYPVLRVIYDRFMKEKRQSALSQNTNA
jgi:rod shape-determining protein MreD